jgi:hypothetical protein
MATNMLAVAVDIVIVVQIKEEVLMGTAVSVIMSAIAQEIDQEKETVNILEKIHHVHAFVNAQNQDPEVHHHFVVIEIVILVLGWTIRIREKEKIHIIVIVMTTNP